MDISNFSKQQLKEMLSVCLEMAEIKEFQEIKNDFFLENINKKPQNYAFRMMNLYIKQFGKEDFKKTISEIEPFLRERTKKTFLNMNLEPRFVSEQTEQILINRHNAIDNYTKNSEAFSLQLEFEPDNPFDDKAIAVYAEGKNERFHVGYISRSFNKRIGELLKNDPFPFIQTNYCDILNRQYSKDNLIIDIYF